MKFNANKRLNSIFIVSLVVFLFIPVGKSWGLLAQERSLNRDEIPGQYKWNLSHIYPNWEAWEQSLKDLEQKMGAIVGLKETLGKGPGYLLKALKLEDQLGMLAFRVFRYPQLMRDTDTRDQEVSRRLQQVLNRWCKYEVAASWIEPEILKIPRETMKKWLDSTPELAPYRFNLENLYRQQAHVLDEERETLLAFFSQFRDSPKNIYTELSGSDIKYPVVQFSDGKKLPMTGGNYGKVLATYPNQEDRKKAFEGHYHVYKKNINTYAAIYHAVCQQDWAAARSRNYTSSLEAFLDEDNVPVEVYQNLVKTVKANVEPLQRYFRLRRKILNLKEYHIYDTEMSLTDFNKTYPYDQAKAWILASVMPLGKEYRDKVKQALAGGWIDVYENIGKRGGAYSANVYGVHPYMLMNYNDTLAHAFALAHELGHTIHTLLANENQPYATHSYSIFVAEVASAFNERLLLDYLLKKTRNPGERIALLEQLIKGLANTFYLQTLLADFELQAHQQVEQGKPITAKILNRIMGDLFKSYYGDSLAENQLLEIAWTRIQQFFIQPYYVYQYATCFASCAQLYDRVGSGPEKQRRKAHKQYLNLLKSGGNDYPMEQLKKAGVDLTEPETIMAVIKQMDELVTLLEREVKKLK
ncbi:MAG: oligoendopeptidase F [Candidatus Aminicenantes bacterium]|nr:MAG: oligoendopeptidase F [Candidatus Aminicenantes bacterium]